MAVNVRVRANRATSRLHPNYSATYYRSLGRSIDDAGKPVNKYAEGFKVSVQLQSQSADELYHQGNTGQNDITRHCYINVPTGTGDKAASIIRALGRTGDFFQHEDGTWWLVTALREDFNKAGWVNVDITLQVRPPDFSGSDWYNGDQG